MTFAVAAVARVDLMVPGEHVSTGMDHLHLVGRATTPAVDVHLNGAFESSVAVRDSIFHAEISLPYGLNEVVVRAADDESGMAADSLEVLRGPRIKSQVAKIFLDYRFHDEDPHAECLDCHHRSRFAADNPDKGAWCASCHGSIASKVEAHAPQDDRTCTNCHLLNHELTLTRQETFAQQNPCFGCHQNKIGEFAREYIHGPVAGGACVICHDPHGSRFGKNLVAPVSILCLGCHTSTINDEAKVQHQPFSNGQCTSCHDPHSTNNRWVLIRSSRKLCLSCHADDRGEFKTHRHPFDVKPKKGIYGLRLADNGELECLTCHDPHATNVEHLLRTENQFTCVGCHPDHR